MGAQMLDEIQHVALGLGWLDLELLDQFCCNVIRLFSRYEPLQDEHPGRIDAVTLSGSGIESEAVSIDGQLGEAIHGALQVSAKAEAVR